VFDNGSLEFKILIYATKKPEQLWKYLLIVRIKAGFVDFQVSIFGLSLLRVKCGYGLISHKFKGSDFSLVSGKM